jgi:predicted cupin superfamily sugar epimerase
MASSITLAPSFQGATGTRHESPNIQAIIDHLKLQEHIEGGYFVETDRDILRVPNPFPDEHGRTGETAETSTRSADTTIHYLLTPESPLGAFHRNKGRTVHTLHRGRGVYVLIHAGEVAASTCPGGYGGADVKEAERWTGKARVEVFRVGQDVLNGERLQWIVDGGIYKSSFLLPDREETEKSEGLLISETVVPGFEYTDHDFMKRERLEALLTGEQVKEMEWMLRMFEA